MTAAEVKGEDLVEEDVEDVGESHDSVGAGVVDDGEIVGRVEHVGFQDCWHVPVEDVEETAVDEIVVRQGGGPAHCDAQALEGKELGEEGMAGETEGQGEEVEPHCVAAVDVAGLWEEGEECNGGPGI